MNQKEAEIVNEDFIARDDVYNITLGGHGGWHHITHEDLVYGAKKAWERRFASEEKLNAFKSAISKSTKGKKIFTSETKRKISETLKRVYSEDKTKCGMFGKHHSEKTKSILSNTHIGNKNGQFGTMWICNDETHESKKISNTSEIPDGWRRGRFCK